MSMPRAVLLLSAATVVVASAAWGEAAAEAVRTPPRHGDTVGCELDDPSGGLTSAQFLKVVAKKRRGIERCCTRAQDAQSTITTRIEISASGAVSSVTSSSDVNQPLSDCIVAEVRRWRFPAAEHGMQVVFPFRCDRSGDAGVTGTGGRPTNR